MKTGILIGVCIIPAAWVALTIIGILWRSTRDAVKILSVPMREGYSRWNWFWILPCCWFSMFKEQVWSWWHGIETTSDFR